MAIIKNLLNIFSTKIKMKQKFKRTLKKFEKGNLKLKRHCNDQAK